MPIGGDIGRDVPRVSPVDIPPPHTITGDCFGIKLSQILDTERPQSPFAVIHLAVTVSPVGETADGDDGDSPAEPPVRSGSLPERSEPPEQDSGQELRERVDKIIELKRQARRQQRPLGR